MDRFRLSQAARADLEDIWVYIAQDNIEAADKLIKLLASQFSRLASNPEIGRSRKELSARLRSFSTGNYVIFYQAGKDEIEVVRVLHGARDLPSLFS